MIRLPVDFSVSIALVSNIKLQHPAALCRSDFAFQFFAIYVQRLLIFSRPFLFIFTTCFGLRSHHQVTAADSFFTITCTPDDDRVGRNM
jgi:hypothetical protein